MIYTVLASGLGEGGSVPCVLVCLDHFYNTGLLSFCIVSNGQRCTETAVAWFGCLDDIGAIGCGIYAIGIGAQCVCLMRDGVLYAVHIGMEVDDEVLCLRNGDTHFGQLAEISLVGNSGKVWRTSQIFVNAAMGTNGVAEPIDLYDALIHDKLF